MRSFMRAGLYCVSLAAVSASLWIVGAPMPASSSNEANAGIHTPMSPPRVEVPTVTPVSANAPDTDEPTAVRCVLIGAGTVEFLDAVPLSSPETGD